jgi:CelD/BcsL family acetyltransferase involved in cellulose biosynthesis
MNRVLIKRAAEDGENIFETLREDWRRLFAEAECSPFLSWEWLSIWHKWFGADSGGREPFILKAYRGDHLIGLLPLCSQKKNVLGMRLKRLGFLGEETGGADYLDLIAKREDKAEIWAAIFDFLKEENDFDLLALENLAGDSDSAQLLQNFGQNTAKKRFQYAEETTTVCPQIDLAGGWDAVLKTSKRASNFKRRLKQLEKMPGFEFRTVTAPGETAEAFERFFQLHEKRWLKQGGSELSGHPRLVSFQRDLVSALSEAGLIRFDEIWAEGECRSSVYGLDDRRAFYYYNSGYDLEWANYSVGLVLIGLSVKSAIERGSSRYDFLRGEETYKFDWANNQKELVTVRLNRRTLPALAHKAINQSWSSLRSVSKSVLPADLLESLKTRRREWKRNYQLSALEAEKTQ